MRCRFMGDVAARSAGPPPTVSRRVGGQGATRVPPVADVVVALAVADEAPD